MIITNFTFNDPHDIYLARCEVEKLHNWYGLSKNKKKEDYIWDEDLTVRQNKERTIQYNNDIDSAIQASMREYNESLTNFNNAVIKYIMEEFQYTDVKCNEAQARIIWSYCICQHEDDAQNWIGDICDLFGKLMEAADE